MMLASIYERTRELSAALTTADGPYCRASGLPWDSTADAPGTQRDCCTFTAHEDRRDGDPPLRDMFTERFYKTAFSDVPNYPIGLLRSRGILAMQAVTEQEARSSDLPSLRSNRPRTSRHCFKPRRIDAYGLPQPHRHEYGERRRQTGRKVKIVACKKIAASLEIRNRRVYDREF